MGFWVGIQGSEGVVPPTSVISMIRGVSSVGGGGDWGLGGRLGGQVVRSTSRYQLAITVNAIWAQHECVFCQLQVGHKYCSRSSISKNRLYFLEGMYTYR